jgi:L-fuconolactonase
MSHFVDGHVHVSPIWYEPVESLLYHLDANGIDQAVLVQQGGQVDNSYLIECVQRFPDRFYAVVMVDAKAEDACEQLQDWAEQGARGVRLRATERSPGDDPLAIWRQAAALDLSISCAGRAEGFVDQAFAQLVQAVPGATFVIEHMGGVVPPGSDPPPFARHRQIFELARYPNVAIKFHGLGEICPKLQPFPQPFPYDRAYLELFDLAYAAFGAERMLWGSDFPPVSANEGYANALRWPLEHFAHLPAAEQALLFGQTARRIYGAPA